jgi:predicted acyl esterase
MQDDSLGFESMVADGMRIDWDVPIPMDDGVVLRADIFRPVEAGRYGVMMSYGPYAKGLAFQEGYKGNWDRMVRAHPEILEGSSNKYQSWELVDPEKWVKDGYVCLRIDSRGAGRSPGVLEVWSPREAQDMYDCVEWAARQVWSNGKVGINGISYYAVNQWHVASLQPLSLAAICVWEGAADYYRDLVRHGGILCDFLGAWFKRQVLTVQHGVGDRGRCNPITGMTIAGPETLTEEALGKLRVDAGEAIIERVLDERYYRERSADFATVTVPLLSAANWGGMGLHPRGNFEGFAEAASTQKWLEVHGDTHFSPFYTDRGVELQKRFFGHFLNGEDTGWNSQPKVQLQIRRPGECFVTRAEQEWPLARTQWTRLYLQPDDMKMTPEKPEAEHKIGFDALGDGVTFLLPVQAAELEITGPVALKLFVSSSTADADFFVILHVFDENRKEVTFIGSNDPRTPVGLGWLRASHRKLDPLRSKPYRPYHTHDELQPLTPGEIYELDIEIWPTCVVVPPGYQLGLTIRGKDYENDGSGPPVANAMYAMRGLGPFTHTSPRDRPPEIFGGVTTLHFGPGREGFLLLPVIAEAGRE